MANKVTAIIDIGKTNKKFFLFDENLQEVHHEYIRFEELPDDDGFPSENLSAITQWMQQCVQRVAEDKEYELTSVNFSTYGASFVHLGNDGKPVAPFYNYLKPIPDKVLDHFFEKYGDRKEFASVTSSPVMGLLNSGFQFYYLKHFKPDLFNKIHRSLHFPQYLSTIFTGEYYSDYTSLGCHTALWDFGRHDYHPWVKEEGIEKLLPPLMNSDAQREVKIGPRVVKVGVGVHDSSSALIPYIRATSDPFILISTGTWSICMNYFNEEELNIEELDKDCLNFLSTRGTNIKASRLFLGKEISNQARLLSEYFQCDYSRYKEVRFSSSFSSKRQDKRQLLFDHGLLAPERFGFTNNPEPDFSIFDSYEDAYFNLIDELTDLQVASFKLAAGHSKIKTVYLDGGFSSNEVFMQLLANKLSSYQLYSSSFAKGTALGAAMIVNQSQVAEDYLTSHYQLNLHAPLKTAHR